MAVTVVFQTREEAEELRDAIADVLCWHTGFAQARGTRYVPPPGIDVLRTENIRLRAALRNEEIESEAKAIFGTSEKGKEQTK